VGAGGSGSGTPGLLVKARKREWLAVLAKSEPLPPGVNFSIVSLLMLAA